jgi:DNA-binding FrmR family transcriptional regulator
VVPGAPGDKAGIREGDIIVSLFGTPVTGAAQLAQAASALQVGLPYPVEVIRGEARLTLTVVQEGGADFSRQSGDSWIARQTDPAVITDVTRQLAASAAFAETAMKEAIAGNLEAARDLAERSAKAMTGELDLTGLPPVEAAIEPRSVAAFGAANASLVEETHRALDELMQAQSEMARAQAVASSSPDEADRIRRDAESKREKAVEKFRQLLAAAGVLRSDPRQASAVAITLSSLNAVVAPPAAPGPSAGPVATPQSAAASAGRPAPATPEEWKDRVSAWRKELEETERQIEATREALLRLNRSILQNAQLFEEWERSSDEAFARCVETAGSLAIDFGIEGLSGRYETIYGLARKLPDPPQALLEKYRHLVEMVQRLKESKALLDASSLVERENESPGEVLETIRDGIGQITGLLNLDKTVPGAAWKYGSLFFDNLYNLAELYHTWKNVTALERSNDQLAEGVRRLSERLKDLHSRSRELRRKIEEAGEDAGSGG